MVYVTLVYRQRDPRGCDLPINECEKTKNGPFVSADSAELYARAVANVTPVFQTEIVEG